MRIAPYIKFALFAIAVSLAVAVADPHHRSTVARVALFTLVGTVTVALVDLAHRRSPPPGASPFEPRAGHPQGTGLPGELEHLASDVRAFRAAQQRGDAIMPAALRRTCRRIADARLAEHRGGGLDDPAGEAAAAAACGPVLWAALEGEPTSLDLDAVVAALEQL